MADSNITKEALAQAMKSLMMEKPFAKISIGDICGRCSMNRQSFYYHFRDKYDLVNWIFYTELIDKMSQHMPSNGWDMLYTVCCYFYENRPFYVHALRVTGQNSFTEYFAQVLGAIVEPFFQDILQSDEKDMHFYITLFTDICKVSICRWLVDEPEIEPERFVRLVRHAVERIAAKVVEERGGKA